MRNTPVWFEKTVEYAYVAKLVLNGQMGFAAPLAGVHESWAGDTVFGNADKFVLVEFKRTCDQLPTEKSLFLDYNKAKEELGEYRHHYFIYGAIKDSKFDLRAELYFDTNEEKYYYDATNILEQGVTKEEFYMYLELLAAHKKSDGRVGSGDGMNLETFSTVLGVSQAGIVVETQALHEYAPNLFPAPSRPDHTPSTSQSPTLKMR
ncbi:hypothetical protein E6B08_23825 [Pseudomonas putida]|uniref:Uncharacterized protein n=1 Tax=Pseudomonas putida TaxID=303 RepID=A0A4D6XF40_PSEPU|nr:hypothetical protein [Pseudomonas putida]QCI14184.1 hypothetical protein E6B08_23825 [Pseudomonas putida]